MITWADFSAAAPHISEIFRRRHAATGNLCFLGTVRRDGSPRISPMEPQVFEDHLVLAGMPGTTKFADLAHDPRLCLHTATVDTQVGDGDAKLFARVVDLRDPVLHRRFADDLFARSGFDLRGQEFPTFYVTDLTGASSVEIVGDAMHVTIWRPGQAEETVLKH